MSRISRVARPAIAHLDILTYLHATTMSSLHHIMNTS
jgi:hypothetical protein